MGGSWTTLPLEGQFKVRPEDLLTAYQKAVANAREQHIARVERYRKSTRYEQMRRAHWSMGRHGSTRPNHAARCWNLDYLATDPVLPGLRRAWMVRSPAGMAVLDAETGKLLDFTPEDQDLLPDLKKSPFIDVHKEAAKKG